MADSCIIRGPTFLQPSLRRNMNQFNALHSKEPNETPRERNSQPTATSPSKTIYMVSPIMGILSNHAIDYGDVEFHNSKSPVESYS